MSKDIKDSITDILKKAIKECDFTSQDIPVYFENQKEKRFGDWSAHIAMKLAKECRKPPMEIAKKLTAYLEKSLAELNLKEKIKNIEIKPPGFINIFLSNSAFYDVLKAIREEKCDFARNQYGLGKKILMEYVSANPTGPLSIAHARQAAVGDTLAKILDFCGYSVDREYYLNDEGNQISKLGLSLQIRYLESLGKKGVTFPEDGYKGQYLADQAQEIKEKVESGQIDADDFNPETLQYFTDFAVKKILGEIKDDLEKFGVTFDNWFSQKSMSSEQIMAVVDELRQKGCVYDKDGATWFKSTEFGDDKDRVLIKSDGQMTYLTPDIFYHKLKFERGYSRLINIWGPDHHGYINRLKASACALGHNKEDIDILIIQLATLFRDGQPVRMSTRAGEYISLRELMEEVGIDAARFFFLMRRCDSHLEFDLELAKKKTLENPVYYVQYAHARIAGILDQQDERLKDDNNSINFSLLKEEEEIDLIRMLSYFQDILIDCSQLLEPQGLTTYLRELAGQFHSFYNKHRVISEDKDLSVSRIVLICCVRQVLFTGLTLLGVSAPERM
ncbi:MAG: arginine--tRNA ligase [Candidatus Omnitrophota bacterium]